MSKMQSSLSELAQKLNNFKYLNILDTDQYFNVAYHYVLA